MIFPYLFLNAFAFFLLIGMIKKKEFDEPGHIVFLIVFIVSTTALMFYMDWFSLELGSGFYDPDWIRK